MLDIFIFHNTLEMICFFLGLVSILLGILVIFDYQRKKKKAPSEVLEEKKEEVVETSNDDLPLTEETTISETISKVDPIHEIKYVEEDTELEKTKALQELARVKEELLQQKEEQENKSPKVLAKEETVPEEKEDTVAQIRKEIQMAIEKEKEAKSTFDDEAEKANAHQTFFENTANYERQEEENAIISMDELAKAATTAYTDDEMFAYKDEENEPISIQELETLYKEFSSINGKQEEKVEPVASSVTIKDKTNFQSTPFISPVYGITSTEDNLQLEQTANLEKLNEEIKKTNEFLMALKELRKHLE